MEKTLKTYTAKEKNYYLLGMAGQNIVFNIIGVGLSLYYTEALYVPASIVAVLMLIARLWDAFNDFIMGVIVDRTRSKWGKCRPYLIYVPLLIMLSTIGAFSATFNYNQRPVLTVVFIYTTYILWGMLYTVGDIPLWGITALMTESEKDRTKLLSLARIAGAIGGAVTYLLYVTVVGLFKNTGATFIFPTTGAYGYFMATLIYAVIGCVLFQLVGFTVREKIKPTYKESNVLKNFRLLARNKPFLQVLGSGVLGSTKAMLASCSGYLILWYYANGNEANTMFYYVVVGGGYFIGNLAAMYLTPAFLKTYSKKDLYNWSHLLSVIPFMTLFVLFLLKLDSIPLVAILIFLAGALQGFPAVLHSSMIADSVDYLEWKTGEKADGLCFAGQTFLAKLQNAVAYYGALMVLSFVNYNPEAMQNYVAAGGIARLQFPEVMTALFVIITVLPALGSVLAVIPTWRYCLTEQEHEKILNDLIEKRRRQDLAAANGSGPLAQSEKSV
ncbi:MAG TPA: glycoside-pentoside-hexuronide (GPH):cation symporter [Bacillota bacterium]|nr:glycoside-pentoside-hexuronide (GPH):cation symporter [Bacillota bacterium]